MKRYLGILGLSFLLVACGDDDASTNEESKGNVVATTGQIADAVKVISGDTSCCHNINGPRSRSPLI